MGVGHSAGQPQLCGVWALGWAGLRMEFQTGEPMGCRRAIRPPKSICGLYNVLPPFQNIRCFSFVKQMYLDIF
jgi:hypothetical protein